MSDLLAYFYWVAPSKNLIYYSYTACPKACRTLILLTVQENRALAGRVKNPYQR